MRVGPGGKYKIELEQKNAEYEAQYGDAVLYAKLKRGKNGEATLDDTLIECFQHLLKEGNTRSNAARVLGIQRTTVAKWLQKGKADIEKGDLTIFAKFTWMVDRCEGGQERQLVQAVFNRALDPAQDGSIALKVLERRNPEAWAPAIAETDTGAGQFSGASRQALQLEAKRVLEAAAKEHEMVGEVVAVVEFKGE